MANDMDDYERAMAGGVHQPEWDEAVQTFRNTLGAERVQRTVGDLMLLRWWQERDVLRVWALGNDLTTEGFQDVRILDQQLMEQTGCNLAIVYVDTADGHPQMWIQPPPDQWHGVEVDPLLRCMWRISQETISPDWDIPGLTSTEVPPSGVKQWDGVLAALYRDYPDGGITWLYCNAVPLGVVGGRYRLGFLRYQIPEMEALAARINTKTIPARMGKVELVPISRAQWVHHFARVAERDEEPFLTWPVWRGCKRPMPSIFDDE